MENTKIKRIEKTKGAAWLYAIVGFLAGACPLGSGLLPFGCALLCAMPKRRRKEVFYGVAASALLDPCIPLGLFCAVYLFLVLEHREKNGGLYMYIRILLSFSISALRASYVALSGINDINGVFSLLTAVIAYPAFTYAFAGYFDTKREIRPKRYDISLLAFAFCFAQLFSGFKIGSESPALLIGALFTLSLARSRGFAFGSACGILCGLTLGGSATGALGVLGMTYGLLVNEVEWLSLILSFMLSVSGYFYLSGGVGTAEAIIMLAIAFGLFLPIRSKITVYRLGSSSAEKRAYDRRLARYATAFSSLSSLFYTVSDCAKEESITDLNGRIVKTVENFCSRCDGCELDKSEISNFFTSEYRRSGVTLYSRIPTHISSRCPNACAMARQINNLPVAREKQGEKGLKQMADEYSAFSTILIDAVKKQDDCHRTDKNLAEQIRRSLSENGVDCDGVKVQGTRIRHITAFGVTPEKITRTPNEISNAVASVLHTRVTPPELSFNDGYNLMHLKTTTAVRVEYAKISEAKDGESVCGDTVSVFENDERYFYCLVSDGMGSGRDAALTSRLSAIMLEKLLTVGAEKESALKLLNKALTEKDEEVFATVDLLEIDRINSTATLIKAGAAPTLLIRKGKLTLIEARTPPAGIMKKLIAEKKTFKLERGDMIVMLSDGVLQTGNEFNLFQTENIPPLPSARAMAGKIMRSARKENEYCDDMSVCALRIY